MLFVLHLNGDVNIFCVVLLQVEQQGSQVETLQQKHLLLLEENQLFKDKILNLDRSDSHGRGVLGGSLLPSAVLCKPTKANMMPLLGNE